MESKYTWRVMVLAFEGGGVKGFSSLLMLQRLMDKIAEIEKKTSLPDGINIDAKDWEPHYSSFAPIPDELEPELEPEPRELTHHSSSFMLRARKDTSKYPSNGDKGALREEMTKQRGKYLPCHYFDYIGGTSTGGLSALMLGRLRLDVKECVSYYQKMSQNIFGTWRLSFKGVWKPKYSSKPLEKEIQDLVAATLPVDDNNMRCKRLAAPDDLCKTVVFAALEDSEGPHLFRTYENKRKHGSQPDNDGPPEDCYIWEAARATSAAPGYFKPISIGEQEPGSAPGSDRPVYVDGSVACNDPTPQLIKEIRTHKDWHQGEELGVELVLTLGTGLKSITKFKARRFAANHFRRLFRTLRIHLMRPGKAEKKMREYAKDHNFTYFKWDGGRQIDGISLDDCEPKTFRRMTEWTDAYMNRPEMIGRTGMENDGELWTVALSLVEERRKRLLRSDREWERFASCNAYRCPLSACLEEPNVFNSRQKAEAHIDEYHGECKGLQTYIQVVSPCLRGPWCHDTPRSGDK